MHIPPPASRLFTTSSLALTAVWYARFYQAEPAPVVGTTKCPESLCLMSALPSSGSRILGSSEDITPRSSLLRTHSPIPCGSPFLRLLASCKESLQIVTSPCCHRSGRTMARTRLRMMLTFPSSPGRAVARIGLRMMPPFPPLSLKFRKAGFSHYGFKVGI